MRDDWMVYYDAWKTTPPDDPERPDDDPDDAEGDEP